MSKRLQVVMTEDEHAEILSAADTRRMTVSEWVRQVLREARQSAFPGAVREIAPGYGDAPSPAGGRSASRPSVPVDDDLLSEVMDRYRFPTREAAVHFALRRAADPPMTHAEILAMQGSGWDGDLDEARSGEDPVELL